MDTAAPFRSRKSPLVTAKLPTAAIVFVVFARLTVPVTPAVLFRMLDAETVPAPVCAIPPPVADRSMVGALTIWPAPSMIPPAPAVRPTNVEALRLLVTPIVPEPIETVPAPVSGPVTPTLPVLTSRKLPDERTMLPIEAMALAVPDSVAPWPIPTFEPSVPVTILLVAACVTPLPADICTSPPACPTTALPFSSIAEATSELLETASDAVLANVRVPPDWMLPWGAETRPETVRSPPFTKEKLLLKPKAASVPILLVSVRKPLPPALPVSTLAVIFPGAFSKTEPLGCNVTVPVPAATVWPILTSPDAVVSETLPLFVVIPMAGATVPTARAPPLVNENPCPAPVTVAASVPTALVPVSVTAFAAVTPNPTAAIDPPVCPTVPAEVRVPFAEPAPIPLFSVMSPDVVVLSTTAPLLVAMPDVVPTLSTVSDFDAFANVRPCPFAVTIAASVPTALKPPNVIPLVADKPSAAAVIWPPV